MPCKIPDVFSYQFRTTTATHLVYSGIDFNSIADYLGHSTAEMALRVYSTQRPPGAVDNPLVYYGLKGVTLEGIAVAAIEPIYMQWLLALTLRLLKQDGTVPWDQVKALVLGQEITNEVMDVVDF
jgi:hypothetical protein